MSSARAEFHGRSEMWRWTRRALVGLCGLVIAAAAAGATYQWLATRRDLAGHPPPGRVVDVGGHRLHIWCMGSGSPAVVLEAGLSCQVIAEESGHVVTADQPQVVVEAIRTAVMAARGS
ncbi:MAG TPA: hypothetical protein VMT87_00540, partial [Vicinamibacteria bacterium]|nr:hypothetical protein [Vicinamibacteria bacterium]